MKLHLRDFFWLMLVAAVATLWWIDRSRLASRVDELENWLQLDPFR